MKFPPIVRYVFYLSFLMAGVSMAQTGNPPMKAFRQIEFVQYDLLRVSPDDAAPFVRLLMPPGAPGPAQEETLSRRDGWEETRFTYWFKFPSSADPNVCATSLFSETFTGFRKIADE